MKTGLPGGPFFFGHALVGVRVQRVQKVQKVQRVVVGGYAANINKTFTTGLCPWEKRKTVQPPGRLYDFIQTGTPSF